MNNFVTFAEKKDKQRLSLGEKCRLLYGLCKEILVSFRVSSCQKKCRVFPAAVHTDFRIAGVVRNLGREIFKKIEPLFRCFVFQVFLAQERRIFPTGIAESDRPLIRTHDRYQLSVGECESGGMLLGVISTSD